MHDDFADWYRPCTTGTEVNLTGDLLEKRWAGVEKAAKDLRHEVKEIVRVTLGHHCKSADSLGQFRAAFKEPDATFQMSGNELELSVLAGSTLCWLFSQECDEADEASLALICAIRLRSAPTWCIPFVSHASAYLDNRLRSLRIVPAVTRPQWSNKKLKATVDDFVTKIAENAPPATSESAKQFLDGLIQTLSSITSITSEAIRQLELQSDLRREETDVLWWLTAAVSRDLGKSFEELECEAASVVAGKELADLVRPPGILPSQSILQRVISIGDELTVGKDFSLLDFVNSTPLEWRETFVGSFHSEPAADVTPVLAAISQSVMTEEIDGWASPYKKLSGIDPKSIALKPVELAQAIHRECLLVRLGADE